MKKKLIAVIVPLLITVGPALKGAANLWHGADGLGDFLIVLVFVVLVTCLVRIVTHGNKADEGNTNDGEKHEPILD